MNLKLLMITTIILALVTACGSSDSPKENSAEALKKKLTQKPKAIDPMTDKGIGPVKEITLGDIDQSMVAEGKTIFKSKCSACHKTSKKFIGPAPKGIMERRTPEWIMNMILNPTEMTEKNPIAKQLLIDYNGSPMANQNLTEEEARAVLEYFRTL